MRADLLRRSSSFQRLRSAFTGFTTLAPLPAALLLAACSSAPPQAPAVAVSTAVPEATPQAPGAGAPITMFIEKRPEQLAVDGTFGEWAYFADSDPATPAAESSLVAAVSAEGVSIAAELAPGAGEALWLAVVLDSPEAPPPIECDESMASAELATCKADAAANEAFSKEHAARFRRFYRIDGSAVSAHDKGALAAVAGAKVAGKKVGKGYRIEATFPPGALPRTLQAPLHELSMYAVGATGQAPPALPEELGATSLDEPIGFEPHAALREAVFTDARRRTLDTPFSISYQPGGDLEVEDVRWRGAVGRSRLHSKKEVLYSKQATMGSVEMGYVYTGTYSMVVPWTTVIALKDGQPLEANDLEGAAKGVVQRDGELHVFAYSAFKAEESPTTTVAWSALAIGADGAVRPALTAAGPELVELVTPVESHAPDFSTLSLTGNVWDANKDAAGAAISATWKYDAKEKQYVPTVKGGAPQSPKKAPGKTGAAKKK